MHPSPALPHCAVAVLLHACGEGRLTPWQRAGELGPARHYVEAAAELRLPVPVLKKQVYLYGEHAQDLSAGAALAGNPKEFYNRPGSGTSLGAGMKLGALRAEVARDCNRGTATWFLHFGERF